MFVLGKKTIDSVNRFISGTRGTSTAFSSGAWEIFFQILWRCLGSALGAVGSTNSDSIGAAVPRMETWVRARCSQTGAGPSCWCLTHASGQRRAQELMEMTLGEPGVTVPGRGDVPGHPGGAVSSRKLHPKEDDRSLPAALVSR